MEWPGRITSPSVSDVNAVTSDMLPTLCSLAGVALPSRPLDGIDLQPLIDGRMTERPSPICFWDFDTQGESGRPWIEPALQQGTTPLVKLMAGKPTRTFRNLRHPEIHDQDFDGARAIIDNRYKLIIRGTGSQLKKELFDLRSDSAEKHNLIGSKPEIAAELERACGNGSGRSLELTGADYR